MRVQHAAQVRFPARDAEWTEWLLAVKQESHELAVLVAFAARLRKRSVRCTIGAWTVKLDQRSALGKGHDHRVAVYGMPRRSRISSTMTGLVAPDALRQPATIRATIVDLAAEKNVGLSLLARRGSIPVRSRRSASGTRE